MKKTVLVFGSLTGAILAGFIAVMVPLCAAGEGSMVIGYSTMVLAYILVFFGIRSYRDGAGGGSITFGRAFTIGILITLIACAFYVVSWEIVYYNFMPDFADKYAAGVIAKMRQSGASAAKIEATIKEMADFKRMYANPFFNVGMTFLEVFPVGLIMTLVSAGILRKRPLEAH